MSVNRYRPHVLILPEDDANTHLANGFMLHDSLNSRAVQTLPSVGGWAKVLQSYKTEHIHQSMRFAQCHFVMLIDFDNDFQNRYSSFQQAIPTKYRDRTYVIGTQDEPEKLKAALKNKFSLEEIGENLGKDCYQRTSHTWSHSMLSHNMHELTRLNQNVRAILF